ncbi:hypothetical protein SMKI_12G4980 [Saccharomyces mikatae IFO 1815]|uniref:Uncharacterized protein n=1 Tax=Saccharomyces mikatae IFO 1815 TaxID=226126 RepID=A0AA35ITT9_SACMI|nr:uncharacterized protein SMKI_12G4980 [Saccharomyces mikatae IFO 1815]CAI4035345.1 hypothetical protein SMKI_12G4980 [Saccharomyces mikatae IFO 1815]
MEHVDSEFAPIRKSEKVVDSDKIVRAINDDLEQRNITILQNLNLLPIKKNAGSSKVSKPNPVKGQADYTFYQNFKSMALQELNENYSSVSYVPGMNNFFTNELVNMKDYVVFFNKVQHIHQYGGIDREVSERLTLVKSNVVIIEMNDYLTKEDFPLNKIKEHAKARKNFQYKINSDSEVDQNALDSTSDLMMMVMKKIGHDMGINHIVYFKLEQLDELSPSTVIIPSRLTELVEVLSFLEKKNEIAFKFLVYSDNISISSLLSETFRKGLNTELSVFEMPTLTCTRVQEHLRKMIKFTFDPGNKLLQLYNLFVTRQLNDKQSNLTKFFEFLRFFPHPFTYLFNAYTEILVQSSTFDGLLYRITNKLTINNYPHRTYNFKRNQRLPHKVTREVRDI